jgi:ankyrin repeat protein
MKIISLFFALIFLIFGCQGLDGPGSKLNIYSGQYYNLIKAISKNDTNQIEYLIKKYKLDLNHRDDDSLGMTLLYWAIYNDKKNSFKKLLDLGADPNFMDSLSTVPVISRAAANPNTDYLKDCLLHHGNPNIISLYDKNGSPYFSPLDAAASGGNFTNEKNFVSNIELLIRYGADVNYSKDYYVPLTTSLVHSRYEKALILLKNGADPQKVRIIKLNSTDTIKICQILKENDENFNRPDSVNKSKMAVIKYLKEHFNLDCSYK